MRAPRTAEAMATVPNCGMLRALQRRRESASRARFAVPPHILFFRRAAPRAAARFVPPHPIFAALPRRNVPARPALLTNHRPHAALHPRPHRRRIKRLGRLANIQYAHSHNALKPLAFLAHTLFYSYTSQIRRCSRSRPLAALSSPVRRCSNGVRCGKRVHVGRRRRRSSSSCCRI